jgi:hydrogenase maturation factor HypF (carbamoyltransferase family)
LEKERDVRKKNKKSFDSLQKKIIQRSKVFKEESLEKKNHCNVLVMGNDWENKFNLISSNILYLPRTPGISSKL